MISYTESSAEYHANAANGSSDIRNFIKSPALYHDEREGIVPQKNGAALVFGTLTHLAMLEPERFLQSIAVKPEDISLTTKLGKEWRELHEGLIVVTQADYCSIHMMQQRMPDEVRRALSSGKSEVTVRNELNTLAVQCRADHWNEAAGIVYDLKTIGAIENVEREIHKRGYHIQSEFYRRVIAAETGSKPAFVLIFVEKVFPFRWRIVELDPDYQAIADEAIDGALHGIVARNKSGCWDDPADLHMIASPPAWMAGDLTEDDEGINL